MLGLEIQKIFLDVSFYHQKLMGSIQGWHSTPIHVSWKSTLYFLCISPDKTNQPTSGHRGKYNFLCSCAEVNNRRRRLSESGWVGRCCPHRFSILQRELELRFRFRSAAVCLLMLASRATVFTGSWQHCQLLLISHWLLWPSSKYQL